MHQRLLRLLCLLLRTPKQRLGRVCLSPTELTEPTSFVAFVKSQVTYDVSADTVSSQRALALEQLTIKTAPV